MTSRLQRALDATASPDPRERLLALAANLAPEPAPLWRVAAREARLRSVLRAIASLPEGAALARAALAGEALRAAEAIRAVTAAREEKRTPDLSPGESAALAEVRRGRDPLFAEAFRDPIADGGLAAVRSALVLPRESVVALEETAAGGDDDTQDGVRFDAARAKFVRARVPKVRSWQLHLRLAQILDWELETGIVFSGRAALAQRLTALARDPDSGAELPGADRIETLVRDLADAAPIAEADVAALLAMPVELDFTAAAGGDRPERLEWRLPPRAAAALLAAIDDARLAARVRETAERSRLAAERTRLERLARLGPVLERHPGKPRRHKRGHWAFVNLASVGQTVAEMRREGGVLPESATRLDSASLRSTWGAHERVKLRFVLNDLLEINVLDDAGYWKIIATFGFPPNHETLSATRPILAAGYLTLERGRIVAIEDDGSMIPGKLGDASLPPMLEVVQALGLDMDVERVASAMRVLDWSAFAGMCDRGGALPDAGSLDATAAHERLCGAAHHERPSIAVAWLRALAASVGREEAARRAARALDGFRLINVSARAFTSGELPQGAEHVDETIAAALVRKAAA